MAHMGTTRGSMRSWIRIRNSTGYQEPKNQMEKDMENDMQRGIMLRVRFRVGESTGRSK